MQITNLDRFVSVRFSNREIMLILLLRWITANLYFTHDHKSAQINLNWKVLLHAFACVFHVEFFVHGPFIQWRFRNYAHIRSAFYSYWTIFMDKTIVKTSAKPLERTSASVHVRNKIPMIFIHLHFIPRLPTTCLAICFINAGTWFLNFCGNYNARFKRITNVNSLMLLTEMWDNLF